MKFMSEDKINRFARTVYDNLREFLPDDEEIEDLVHPDEPPIYATPPQQRVNPNFVFPILAITGAVFGIILFFAMSKLESDKKPPKPPAKPKPKTKVIKKTITKVRDPTNEEIKKFVEKRKAEQPPPPTPPPDIEEEEEEESE